MRKQFKKRYIALILVAVLPLGNAIADDKYLCEIGLTGGVSYYVGDAQSAIFRHAGPLVGGIFRYNIGSRWIAAVRAQGGNFGFRHNGTLYTNTTFQADFLGEFNFFKLERNSVDRFAKRYSPYLFAGLGFGVYGRDRMSIGSALPFGFGLKWSIAPRWNLNVAWQHQLYFADNMEDLPELDNSYELNGYNFLNNDLTSSLTLSITFNFWKEKKVCRFCDEEKYAK